MIMQQRKIANENLSADMLTQGMQGTGIAFMDGIIYRSYQDWSGSDCLKHSVNQVDSLDWYCQSQSQSCVQVFPLKPFSRLDNKYVLQMAVEAKNPWYRPVQTISISFQHHFGRWRFHFLIYHQYADTTLINTSTTSAATHLDVLSTWQPSESITVKLSHIGKHNSLCRHVQSNTECFCGKQTL